MNWRKKKEPCQNQAHSKFIVDQSQINKRVTWVVGQIAKTIEMHEKAIRMLDKRITK